MLVIRLDTCPLMRLCLSEPCLIIGNAGGSGTAWGGGGQEAHGRVHERGGMWIPAHTWFMWVLGPAMAILDQRDVKRNKTPASRCFVRRGGEGVGWARGEGPDGEGPRGVGLPWLGGIGSVVAGLLTSHSCYQGWSQAVPGSVVLVDNVANMLPTCRNKRHISVILAETVHFADVHHRMSRVVCLFCVVHSYI